MRRWSSCMRFGLRGVVLRALVARLGIDLGQLGRDLFAALGHALRLLREHDDCELSLVLRLLQLLDRGAQRIERGLALIEPGFSCRECAPERRKLRLFRRAAARVSCSISRCRDSTPCSSESGAWKLTLWRVKTCPSPDTSSAPAGNRSRRVEALVPILDDIDLVQPVVERAGRSSVLAMHVRGQRLEPGHRDRGCGGPGVRGVNRHLSRRQITEPGCCLLEIAEAYAVQALAQHRFQRVFPAGLDLDVLPQAARRIQTVRLEPALHLFAARNAVLHLLQRDDARLERRHLLRGGIHRCALLAQRLLELRNARLFGFELAALVALLRIELGELGAQAFEFQTVRRRQRRTCSSRNRCSRCASCARILSACSQRVCSSCSACAFSRYRLLQRDRAAPGGPERLFRHRQLRRLSGQRCLARIGLLPGALLFLLPVVAARMLRLQLSSRPARAGCAMPPADFQCAAGSRARAGFAAAGAKTRHWFRRGCPARCAGRHPAAWWRARSSSSLRSVSRRRAVSASSSTPSFSMSRVQRSRALPASRFFCSHSRFCAVCSCCCRL